jgi:hypothetical protein
VWLFGNFVNRPGVSAEFHAAPETPTRLPRRVESGIFATPLSL